MYLHGIILVKITLFTKVKVRSFIFSSRFAPEIGATSPAWWHRRQMTGMRRGGGSLLLQVELGLEAGHQLVHLVLAVEGEHQVGHELLVEVILALRIGEYVDSRHTDII